jgi:hypothetical protein
VRQPQVDAQISTAIAAAGPRRDPVGEQSLSFAFAQPDGRRFAAHVLPLTGGFRERLGGQPRAVSAMFIQTVGELQPLSGELLVKLYGLTHAETRLIDMLARDHSLEESATALGIARTTARTHLKHIFEGRDAAAGATDETGAIRAAGPTVMMQVDSGTLSGPIGGIYQCALNQSQRIPMLEHLARALDARNGTVLTHAIDSVSFEYQWGTPPEWSQAYAERLGAIQAVGQLQPLPGDVLVKFYGLTFAETRLVGLLASGRNVEEAGGGAGYLPDDGTDSPQAYPPEDRHDTAGTVDAARAVRAAATTKLRRRPTITEWTAVAASQQASRHSPLAATKMAVVSVRHLGSAPARRILERFTTKTQRAQSLGRTSAISAAWVTVLGCRQLGVLCVFVVDLAHQRTAPARRQDWKSSRGTKIFQVSSADGDRAAARDIATRCGGACRAVRVSALRRRAASDRNPCSAGICSLYTAPPSGGYCRASPDFLIAVRNERRPQRYSSIERRWYSAFARAAIWEA